MTRASLKEKIANDFLAQLTYTIIAAIVLIFFYNGALFKYGTFIGMHMHAILWIICGICAAAGILFLALGRRKDSSLLRKTAWYLFATVLIAFILTFGEKIAYGIAQIFPDGSGLEGFFMMFANFERIFRCTFILLGLSMIGELIVYFYRVHLLKKRSAAKRAARNKRS